MNMSIARRAVLKHVDDCAQSFRIARRLGISRASVQSALRWLREMGLVEFTRSRWDITPAGRRALEQDGGAE